MKSKDNFLYDPVTIVMPVLNQLHYTKECIDSILKNTTEQFEFLIIDNSSTDGTKEYLDQIKDERFRIIHNEKNVGVSKSWNQGIREAKYDTLCIINNDIIVFTKNWLYLMEKTLKEDDKNRWVGPRICYNKEGKLSYKKAHYEQIIYKKGTDSYVVGCCFMCPKKLFTEEVGFFDEVFDIRYYEDLDYLARVWSGGYKTAMSIPVIYHAVGATSRITPGGESNLKHFNEKWGHTKYTLKWMMKN
jgi:GT2 family glycosyltransferase